MDSWPFIYHKVRTRYPDAGTSIKFGKSWTFTAPPDAPVEREFVLKIPGLRYFLTTSGKVDFTTNVPLNAGALEKFYAAHLTHSIFSYKHPVHGTVAVRFKDPLDLPDGITGGYGVLDQIEVTFVEIPGYLPDDSGGDEDDVPENTLIVSSGAYLTDHLNEYVTYTDNSGGDGIPTDSIITSDGDALVSSAGKTIVLVATR